MYIDDFFLMHKLFQMPFVDANNTAAPALPSLVHVHTDSLSPKHGLRHHKLTTLHDPNLSGLLSAESAESAEAVPVAVPVAPAVVAAAPAAAPAADPAADPAPAVDSALALDASVSAEVPVVVVKRDVAAAPQIDPIPLVPVCPGRVRFF